MNRIGNTFLLVLMVFCLVVAPGCSALQKISELSGRIDEVVPLVTQGIDTGKKVVESGKKVVEDGKQMVVDMKEMERKARIEADTDKSGSLDSIAEWLKYAGLVAVGGGGILGGRKIAQVQRRKREEEIVTAVKKAAKD